MTPAAGREPGSRDRLNLTACYRASIVAPHREANDWNENAGSRFAKMGCGFLFVLALIAIIGIWAPGIAACGVLAVFFGFSECPQDLFALFF